MDTSDAPRAMRRISVIVRMEGGWLPEYCQERGEGFHVAIIFAHKVGMVTVQGQWKYGFSAARHVISRYVNSPFSP